MTATAEHDEALEFLFRLPPAAGDAILHVVMRIIDAKTEAAGLREADTVAKRLADGDFGIRYGAHEINMAFNSALRWLYGHQERERLRDFGDERTARH